MIKRRYKTGADREQVFLLPPRVEDYVSKDAVVRAIDVYVETLDVAKLGFSHADGGNAQGKGQPAYDPAVLLKLYLYGYLHKVRSSRMLERETHINLEVIWLLSGLRPSYKTIADFRKDNAKALRSVNGDFIILCRDLKLFGGKKCAVDGSFFHGNASKASIYKKDRLDKELHKLEEQIARYQKELEAQDKADDKADRSALDEDRQLAQKLVALKKKQHEKQALKDQLEASGETQISTTDQDARLLNKGNGTLAGYNVQIVTDDKNRLIVASDVTHDGNDLHQLHRMAKSAKEALNVDELEMLADTGYHDSFELAACEDEGVTTFVPAPDREKKKKRDGLYTSQDFRYDEARDIYQCPADEKLSRFGEPAAKNGRMRTCYASKKSICDGCPVRDKCITGKTAIKKIYRQQYQGAVDRQRQRMAKNKGKMRERSGMVEHPFGTLKHRAGWTHFLVRGFKKVGGEWALMAVCYNFSRVLNIIGFEAFRDYCLQHREKRTLSALKKRLFNIQKIITPGFVAR